jgi:hypothetical protein
MIKYVAEAGEAQSIVDCWFVSWHGCLRLPVPQQVLLHKSSGASGTSEPYMATGVAR